MENINKKEGLVLEARTFSRFKVSGMGTELDSGGIRSEMIMKLMAYLLCHRDKALSVQELSDALWADGASGNPAGALKNLMYRLRSLLRNTWGDWEYILTGRESYQWNPEITVRLDAEEFEEACRGAEQSGELKREIELNRKAIDLYKGMFLTELSSEYWVVTMSTYYHSRYLTAVKRLCGCLESLGEYAQIEDICGKALRIDNLDESVHGYLIRSLAAEDKYKLAIEHYKETVALLYDTLGVRPSRELRGLFENLQKQNHENAEDISAIEEDLRDTPGEKGAFFCEYGVFRKIYAQQARSSERLGISTHLALLTLVVNIGIDSDTDGYRNLMKKAMTIMQNMCLRWLRSGDTFCRYSESQFLIMLPACQYESAVMVMRRLEDRFFEEDSKRKIRINYSLDEVVPA